MANSVTVGSGARLHFGLLAIEPPVGRRFGGMGVMVDQPGFHLRATPAAVDEITAVTPDTARRVTEFLHRYRQTSPCPPVKIHVRDEIPGHSGLGSGTQLGLAVGTAVSRLFDAQPATLADLARRVGRGRRSAIGIHGFASGGLLVEAGQAPLDELGVLVTRLDFPAQWRWLLITPQESLGLSGQQEQQAFQRLSPMAASLTAQLCRMLLMDLLPAVLTADFEAASESLYDYNRAVGDYFSPVQGGPFADPRMTRLADQLRRDGIRGVGQTSWGPTIAVLCRDLAAAGDLEHNLIRQPIGEQCRLRIVAPLNTGASVVVVEE